MDFPDFSQLSKLPWGLAFGALTVFGLLRRKSGHRAAKQEFPKLAERLGLSFRPSPYRTAIGRLVGTRGGRTVLVDPDDLRGIRIQVLGDLGLDLSLQGRSGRPSQSLEAFRTQGRRGLARLERRYGTPQAIARLESAPLTTKLDELLLQRELRSFSLSSDGLVLTFDFGSPPFLPMRLVESLVPWLIEFLDELVDPDTAAAASGESSEGSDAPGAPGSLPS